MIDFTKNIYDLYLHFYNSDLTRGSSKIEAEKQAKNEVFARYPALSKVTINSAIEYEALKNGHD
jgi:hypothetical protein